MLNTKSFTVVFILFISFGKHCKIKQLPVPNATNLPCQYHAFCIDNSFACSIMFCTNGIHPILTKILHNEYNNKIQRIGEFDYL